MDDHVSRILKMLEEGKISATEAQTLIAALQTEARNTASGGGSSGSARTDGSSQTASTQPEPGKAKSFEFQWSQKRAFPNLDLSGLGKQISDAVKKIDPERIVREARAGVARGGKRFSAGFKGFTWFADFADGRPENTMNYPVARGGESLDFDLAPGSTIQAENNWGSIAVFGGRDKVTLEYDKEAWASTEPEAQALLEQIKVEAGIHAGEAGSRLEIQVHAPEGWHQGTANLRLHVPDNMVLKLAAIFGEVRVENMSAAVEVHAISGIISLDNLKGDVHAEGISGEIRTSNIGGALHLASKSGDIKANDLAKGGTIAAVSGDVHVTTVEGGRIEAKSVSGDVLIEKAGKQQPVDITVESVSGNLKLEDARGNIALKTVSGHVSGYGLDALTLQAQTVSGSVDVALESPFAGTLTANTVSGDVSLVAPASSNFRFTIATQSGKLDCAHETHDGNRSDTLWTGTVGTGAGNVTVQTRSGDVRLEKTA